MDIAVVGAGVNLTLDDKGVCSEARVSLGAVAERALLVPEAAAALIGTKVDAAALDRLAPPRARPAGRSTTSAAPRNSGSRSPACWRGARPRSRSDESKGEGLMAKHHVTRRSTAMPSSFCAKPAQTLLDVLRDELRPHRHQGRLRHRRLRRLQRDRRRAPGVLVPRSRRRGARARRSKPSRAWRKGETLHPLQRKFLEHAALQCGICTPGILIAARSLLERNPDPTEEEVRFWLAGNLCRCTGYHKIVDAVLDAAREMRGG